MIKKTTNRSLYILVLLATPYWCSSVKFKLFESSDRHRRRIRGGIATPYAFSTIHGTVEKPRDPARFSDQRVPQR